MTHEAFIQSGLAFLEGIGLVLSPCILPILPLILAGGATGDRRKPFGIITGFILSFTVFALLSRQIFALLGLEQDTIQKISYAILALLGLVMLVPALEEAVAKATQGLASRAQGMRTEEGGFFGGMLMGLLIGIVWTPCAGPILAAALLQVIQSRTNIEAVATIFLFSLGAAIPMFVIAISGRTLAQKFGRYTKAIRRAMGVILLVFAGLGLLGINVGAIGAGQQSPSAVSMAKPGELEDALAQPYPAPAIEGITRWFNSPPLTSDGLKGKVVLIDFWTYSCVNCLRTLPYIKSWHEKYHDKGLVIIGVHAPEFAFEGKPENVEAAVKKLGVAYPVAMDNGYHTWDNFKNQFWPAHYLIDRTGKVVYTHFGEGRYDVTEHNIRTLLGIEGEATSDVVQQVSTPGQTPETYVGTARAAREWTGDERAIPLHGWHLSGGWSRAPENIVSTAAGDTLTLHFQARKVFLVMTSTDGKPVQADISVDPAGAGADVKEGHVTVSESRLYELVDLPKAGEGTLRIKASSAGLQAYAFTFGN